MPNFDRIKAGLGNFVRGVFPRIDYLARFPGTVVAQGGANSFDFEPDSRVIPGVSGVPVRFGLPGVSVQLALGNKPRAMLGFAGGNPSAPFLDLWEQPGLSSLTVDPAADVNLGPAAAAVGRVGDSTGTGTLSMLAAPSGPATLITFQWVPEGGGPPVVLGTITLTAAGGTAAPGTPAPLVGKVTAGSPKVKA